MKDQEIDLAYMAGVFDGEGSVGISKLTPKVATQNITYRVRAEVSNTDRILVELFHTRFGGSIVSYPRTNQPNSKPYYTWIVSNKAAYEFLKTITNYLRSKQERAQTALDFYGMCVQQRASGGKRLPSTAIPERELFYQQMRLLNKRGI